MMEADFVSLTVLSAAELPSAISSDGEYTIEVELSGGTGRASVTSPAELVAEDGTVYARIEWSSPHYDYMILEGETYLPVNEDGNSVFEIPVTVFDEPVTVIADTTAMSVPHEIEYTLIFDSDTIRAAGGGTGAAGLKTAGVVIAVAVVCLVIALAWRKKRKSVV